MATALHAFTNHEFGTIRTITSGGQVLFYGKDVATALGYANTKDALVRYCKGGRESRNHKRALGRLAFIKLGVDLSVGGYRMCPVRPLMLIDGFTIPHHYADPRRTSP